MTNKNNITTQTVKEALEHLDPSTTVNLNYNNISVADAISTYSIYKVSKAFIGYGNILTLRVTIKGSL